MLEFFKEGGWVMYPVLVIGLVLVASGAQYAMDREPSRRPFIVWLSLAHLAFIVQGVLTDVATVFWALTDESSKLPAQFKTAEMRVPILLQGLKESSRPAVLGIGLLGIALLLVSIGAYRTSQRELRAARG